jgi:hypothetical protein
MMEWTAYGQTVQMKRDRIIPVFPCQIIENIMSKYCSHCSAADITRNVGLGASSFGSLIVQVGEDKLEGATGRTKDQDIKGATVLHLYPASTEVTCNQIQKGSMHDKVCIHGGHTPLSQEPHSRSPSNLHWDQKYLCS